MAMLSVLRREVLSYFLSPVSYIIAALFLVVHGYSFFLLCQVLSRRQAQVGGVMQYFFGGTFLYWLFLMFVVSVLTMRLIAEERARGTIEPLLCAPVSEAQVVLGKYAAALCFYLFLWAPTLAYPGLLSAYAGAAQRLDAGPILGGYLGTLLVGMSAIGVGLLASALTRSQLLSAVLSFTALSMLLLIGMIADLYVKGETARRVLLYMNLFHHMDELARGIVDSRRVVYHLSLAILAVFAAGRVLSARPGDRVRLLRAAAEVLLGLALLVGASVIASRSPQRLDLTRTGQFRLSERAHAALADLAREGRTVAAYVFMYDDGDDRNDLYDDTHELLLRAEQAAGGRLKAEFIDVDRDRDRARLLAERFHIDKDDLREGIIVVEHDGRTRFIGRGELAEYEPMSADPEVPPRLIAFHGESALISAILSVLSKETREVCFTRGHGEAEHESMTGAGLSALSEALRREGYALRALEQLAEVPPSCSVLLIAGPERAFLASEAAVIEAFLARGGRLLMLVSPLLDRGLTRFLKTGLEDLLRQRGILLRDAVVFDPERQLGGSLAFITEDGYRDHPVSAPLMRRRTLWTLARPVRAVPTVPLQGGALWSASELVITSERGFGETDLAVLADGPAEARFDEGKDDAGPVPVAAASEVKEGAPRERAGRIVVLGSAQLATNDSMVLYNRDLILSAIAWLADAGRRVIIEPKRPDSLRLLISEEQMTRLLLVVMVGMPLMALLLGAGVFWIRRS